MSNNTFTASSLWKNLCIFFKKDPTKHEFKLGKFTYTFTPVEIGTNGQLITITTSSKGPLVELAFTQGERNQTHYNCRSFTSHKGEQQETTFHTQSAALLSEHVYACANHSHVWAMQLKPAFGRSLALPPANENFTFDTITPLWLANNWWKYHHDKEHFFHPKDMTPGSLLTCETTWESIYIHPNLAGRNNNIVTLDPVTGKELTIKREMDCLLVLSTSRVCVCAKPNDVLRHIKYGVRHGWPWAVAIAPLFGIPRP